MTDARVYISPDPWTHDMWTDLDVTAQDIEMIAAWRRNDGLCGICGEPVDPHLSRGKRRPCIDHIVPLSKGGMDCRANIQIAHVACNSWKGNRDLGLGGERVPSITIEVRRI